MGIGLIATGVRVDERSGDIGVGVITRAGPHPVGSNNIKSKTARCNAEGNFILY